MRRALSIGWSQAATQFFAGSRVVRHALHPSDFDSDRLITEIERSLVTLLSDREVAPYRRLLDGGACH
jgi:hypothetical protein